MNNTRLQQLLLDKGYRYHKSEGYKTLKSTEHLYQKRIRDEKGTRYFIDVWYYPVQCINGHRLAEGIQLDCHLHDNQEEFLMEVRPNIPYTWIQETGDKIYPEDCLDKAEGVLDGLWKFTGEGYYEMD